MKSRPLSLPCRLPRLRRLSLRFAFSPLIELKPPLGEGWQRMPTGRAHYFAQQRRWSLCGIVHRDVGTKPEEVGDAPCCKTCVRLWPKLSEALPCGRTKRELQREALAWLRQQQRIHGV